MKILFLVLFFLFTSLSCKQNPRNMLSSPPKIEEKITNNNTGSSNTNSGSNNDLNSGSGYGYYDVSVLENNGTIKTVKYRISDTDKLLKAYSNMIIDSKSGKPRFELSKNSNPPTTTTETYTFDTNNLNLIKKEANKNAGTSTVSKKFRGVCIVRIYPDATKTANSSLLGNYTIAGVYTEMEETKTSGGVAARIAMTNSETFQNFGYDELIILRTDKPKDDNTKNYRADILFNDDEPISLYNYDPDRTFANQNINYNFVVKATP